MMNQDMPVKLALPSKGALEKSTLEFLAASGFTVTRPNTRQYTASISSVPGIMVLFQRVADIVQKVADGSVDLGITGYDLVSESGAAEEAVIVLQAELGFGRCQLVAAVPESWIDVTGVDDLADVAMDFRERGRELRIATKYPTLTREWLYGNSIRHFALVGVNGALEAAPKMGYADMIVDLSSSGVTLRENTLKRIEGGTLLESQACLIGNRRTLARFPSRRETVRVLLEQIEARARARAYLSVSATLPGDTPAEIAARLHREDNPSGLRGATIAPVYRGQGTGGWYAVNMMLERAQLLKAVDCLRQAGGTDVTVIQPDSLFAAESASYTAFVDQLTPGGGA